DDDRRQEEWLEDRRDRVDDALRNERRAKLEREERIDLPKLGARAVGLGDHDERAELLLDEEADVVAREPALEAPAHAGADLVEAPPPVGLFGHHVEELRELDDLAVLATGDVGRLLEARALVDPDQL